MLTVHHLGISQSDRVVWLCEELGIPYDLKRYERDPETRLAPREYKALHMAGTAPVISEGPMVLGESAAILEYIAHVHGGGRLVVGPGHRDYAAFLYWFHFSNGSMMPAAMVDLALNMAGVEGGSETLRSLRGRIDRAYELVEMRLGQTPYFAGDEFTIADVMMMFPLTTLRLFVPRDISDQPNLLAYLQRVGNRPAFRTAMAKADPDLPLNLT